MNPFPQQHPMFLRGPTIRAQGRRTPNGQQGPQDDQPPSYMEVMRGIILSGGSCTTPGSPGGPSTGVVEVGSENSVMSPTSIFTVEEQFMREIEDQQRSAAPPPSAPAGHQSGRSQEEGQGDGSAKISTVQVLFGFSLLMHMVQMIVVLCWLLIFGSGLYMTDDMWAGAFAVVFFFCWIACETYFVKVALVADHMSDIRMFNYWMKYLEVLISLIAILVITLFFRDPQKLNSANCLFLGSYFLLYGVSYLFADLRLQEVKNEAGDIGV